MLSKSHFYSYAMRQKADNGCYREDSSIPYLTYPPIINVHWEISELLTKVPYYQGLNQDNSTITRERTSQYDI